MKDHEEFSTLSAAERRELIIAELKRKSRIRTLLRGLPLDEVREIIDRMKGVLNWMCDYESVSHHPGKFWIFVPEYIRPSPDPGKAV